MNTPVLFIVFNRPDTTSLVFQAIRDARPNRLYVAADGPRPGNQYDIASCDAARIAATQVDWPCELKTLFRDSNLGCKWGPASAISWFFENEEEGIILEDDVVPFRTFFPFCEELLERYRTDLRVSHVCGNNPVSSLSCSPQSYFFSIYGPIWGWATWRRAWADFDANMRRWPAWRDGGGLKLLSSHSLPFEDYWRSIFDLVHGQVIDDVWDYQWLFSNWRNGRLAILPRNNLTQNIGFKGDATHTRSEPAYVQSSAPAEMLFPLNHAPCVSTEPQFDSLIGRTVFGITRYKFLVHKLKRIPIVGPVVANLVRAVRNRR
jgi:hypothetical protein